MYCTLEQEVKHWDTFLVGKLWWGTGLSNSLYSDEGLRGDVYLERALRIVRDWVED